MEYIYYIIFLLIGSGFGYICCGLFAGASITELDLENTLLKGALREKERELDNLSQQHGWLEQAIVENSNDFSLSTMKVSTILSELKLKGELK